MYTHLDIVRIGASIELSNILVKKYIYILGRPKKKPQNLAKSFKKNNGLITGGGECATPSLFIYKALPTKARRILCFRFIIGVYIVA
jgi:hypothetical protein